jgi:signal transduction histidine kinase
MSGTKQRPSETPTGESDQRVRSSYTAELGQHVGGGRLESCAPGDLTFLGEASYRLASSIDFTEALNVAAELAAMAVGGSSFIYLLGDSGAPECVARAGSGTQAARGDPAGFGAGPASILQVLGSGQSLPLAPVQDAGPSGDAQVGAAHGLIVALPAREAILGAMLVQSHFASTLDPAKVTLLEVLGRWIGLALDNAHRYGDADANRRAQKELISIAAHELRSPLSALRLALQIGLSRHRRGEALEPALLEKAIAQTDRLDGLISSVLDRSQAEVNLLSSAGRKGEEPPKKGTP